MEGHGRPCPFSLKGMHSAFPFPLSAFSFAMEGAMWSHNSDCTGEESHREPGSQVTGAAPAGGGRSEVKLKPCGFIARRATNGVPLPGFGFDLGRPATRRQRSISRNAWIRIFVRPSRGPGSSPSSVRTGRPISSRSRMSSIWRKQNDWT